MEEEKKEKVINSTYIFPEIYIDKGGRVIYIHDRQPQLKKRPRRNPKKKRNNNNNNENTKVQPPPRPPQHLELYADEDEPVTVERIKGFGRLVLK